ncbi:MAG TPA: outer membrane protein transport protein [Thermoanaerobaculia bacterium]|nr:outer membrane protein transport protein [Thermoanaerobaculia bacterium]
MPRRPAVPIAAALAVLAALALAAPAAGAGFEDFLHGGRATGQAGAFVARADDPAALRYNPAGIVHTDGWELQLGLDFENSTDEFNVAGEDFRADHSIQFPPAAYLTWSGDGPWAWGFGLDAPYWYRVDFDPVGFPGRFQSRVIDVELWEAHPVLAVDVGGGWSLGGGVRYLFGGIEQGTNASFGFAPFPLTEPVPVEIFLDADSDVDGYGWDVGAQYRDVLWGFGATYRSGVEVEGTGELVRSPRDVFPDLEDELRALLGGPVGIEQSMELPPELAAGVWFAPYPELRVELDAVLTSWGDFAQTFEQRGGSNLPTPTDVQRSGWDDTLSLRLGLEGDVTDALVLSAGAAWEPSPVPGNRVDPAFFRGDATIYAVGLSYNFPQLSFDLGYSFHDYDRRGATVVDRGFPPPDQPVAGRFTTREQAWSASARWRF